MHRIFVKDTDIFQPFVIKDKNEIHHALHVLRLKAGESVVVFDGKGNEVLGKIKSIDNLSIGVIPMKVNKKKDKMAISITLACALPKKAKFDFIVEKATELGVDEIIPLITRRTEVRLAKEKQAAKIKHWVNIAVSAAKQSQRASVPQINGIKTFNEALSSIEVYDLVLFPCLFGDRKSLKEILKDNSANKILIFIGPEGDFTEEEAGLALKNGAKPVSFGEAVLRVDTAAIYAVSAIKALRLG